MSIIAHKQNQNLTQEIYHRLKWRIPKKRINQPYIMQIEYHGRLCDGVDISVESYKDGKMKEG